MAKPLMSLDELRAQVADCTKCALCEGRTQTVFGVGNPHARVLIVGEAPGKNEDLQGEPFVGAAGKYLNELLAIAGLTREDVFIANVLKCRPPGNRDPRPEEIQTCTPFLREQTRIINPEFIVTLGNFATKFILKTEVGITKLHGTLQKAGRFNVFPIFHPAAALYDGKKREALEDDFQTLGRLLEESDFDPVEYINTPRWQESRLGLDRTRDLMDRLGRPQDALRFVHVAGTNGKGSTCSFLAASLQAAGYRVGLFTSPYIETFEERIRVDGQNISMADLKLATLAVKQQADAMEAATGDHPTEFELMTAVALVHFARMKCDIVVLEVGLGGRLDSTNIIDAPEVCVIARIGLDHTAVLGNTEAEVAAEKAGIIKAGAAVVSWPQDQEAMEVVERAAAACGCVAKTPDFAQLEMGSASATSEKLVRTFSYRGDQYETQLLGSYQPYNAALAIEAVNALRERGWQISDEALQQGIASTVWPARFEVVASNPITIVDGGHNPQGAAVLAESLRDVLPGVKPTFIMSVLADKDYRAMLDEVLPLASSVVAVTPPNPRALSAEDLAAVIGELAPEVPVTPMSCFADAVAEARNQAGEDGVIVAFGSLYSVGELKKALR